MTLPSSETHYDSIIIGAGVSGLNAARLLKQQNRSVLVLEAKDRIGGRVFTEYTQPDESPLELGAEFVHGCPSEISSLITENDLFKLPGGISEALPSGKIHCEPRYHEQIESLFQQISSSLDPDIPLSVYLSKQFPNMSLEDRQLIQFYVEGYHAAGLDQISTVNLANLEKDSSNEKVMEEMAFFKGGYQKLINRLSRPILDSIRLNQVVRKIDWRSSFASVETEGRGDSSLVTSFTAQTVLITVPIGVLQTEPTKLGGILFEPPLPDKTQRAIHSLKMGQSIKIHYVFKFPFWEKIDRFSGTSILFERSTQNPPFQVWWPRGRSFVGSISGPRINELWSDLSPKVIRSTGIQSLSQIFQLPPQQMDDLLEKVVMHNWNEDPFARGAYHFVSPGGQQAHQDLSEPLSNTVFFAGEGTQGGGYSGTVNGALLSSLRATRVILHTLSSS